MYKILFVLTIFFNLFFNTYSYAEKFDQDYKKIFDDYETCEYVDIKREHTLTIEYDLYEKLNLDKSPYVYNCNKILEKIIFNEDHNFQDLIDKAILNNESEINNIIVKIYKNYHLHIIWHSKDKLEVKKSLDELESNYLKRSNIEINIDAVHLYGSLGWFYHTNKDFFNFKKAHDYLSIAVNNEKDHYRLKYYKNNLGVVYDQDRYGTFSKKRNNQIAFKLYKEAAEFGLYHAYGNLGKFYVLGLGGVKKDYDNAIKFYKLKRVAAFGDDDFSDLRVLYNKKRLPLNLKEYLKWLEDYLILSQDSRLFQQLAWLTDEDELSQNNDEDFINMYKWQYLCSNYCKSVNDRERANGEMFIIKKTNLKNDQVLEAEERAQSWYKKNWNKVPNSSIENIEPPVKTELIDLIKNAFIKN